MIVLLFVICLRGIQYWTMSRKSMRCCSCLPAMHILLNSDEPRGARPRPPAAATMLLSSIVDGDRPRYVCFATELLRVGEC